MLTIGGKLNFNMEQPTITIFLSTEEAISFREFQKHRQLFNTLQSKGVFDIQFGKCTLNFAFGELQNVVKEEVIFKK